MGMFKYWRQQALTFLFLYGSHADQSSIQSHLQNRESRNIERREGNNTLCKFLHRFPRKVAQFRGTPIEIKCKSKGIDWVKCNMSKCKVVPSILNSDHVICKYRDILYKSGGNYIMGPQRELKDNASYTLVKSDHVRVKCTTGRHKTWTGNAIGFREIPPRPPILKNEINIQIVMFELTSKNEFMRNMPLSYKTLTKDLNAVLLNRHNIVGHRKAAPIFPMLTGKPKSEFEHFRKSSTKRLLDEEIPLIFYLLRDKGYRTLYFEDGPWYGTFTSDYNGFQEQPVDHYPTPFMMVEYHMNKIKFRKDPIAARNCVGDKPQYKIMLEITRQFMELSSPRFGMTFMVNLFHEDYNMITNADSTFSQFLLDFKKSEHAKNTVLIVMGDHGESYLKLQQTAQEQQEELLPLVAFILPSKLKKQRPDVLDTLKENANMLTTNFDIHSTLLDIFGLKNYRNNFTVTGSHIPRSISLFEMIPKNRSCKEAGIDVPYCPFFIWGDLSKSDKMYQIVCKEIVKFINRLTSEKQAECATRNLIAIKWVKNAKVTWDLGTVRVYQAQIVTNPGGGIYEAVIKYDPDRRIFDIQETDITRVNAYRDGPDCIIATHPHLRKYCFCKNKINRDYSWKPKLHY